VNIRWASSASTSINAEIYSATGMKLKAASPLSSTMLVTIANSSANS